MLAFSLAFLALCLLFSEYGLAVRIPLQGRTTFCDPCGSQLHRLHPRANTSVAIKSSSNTDYLANITVGGTGFTVLLDTGSSDLWMTGNIPNMNDLGKGASVTYAVGKAQGRINAVSVEFSGYEVSDQAIIYVPDASGTGIELGQVAGILGLGPSSASSVRLTLGGSSGDPFLDRVFRQNTSTPNFITFLLGREGDTGSTIQGQFTIGEAIPGFESITNQPKLSVGSLLLKSDQHWSGVIDAIIGPDGHNIPLNSLVPDTPSGKAVAIFDSGFTLPQVPRDISDAIYGRVQGANYDVSNGWWTIPCDQEVNLTVVITGQNYPVHPLDVGTTDLNLSPVNGKKICVGAFQPISTALDGTFDIVLGMGFLRNTYTLIDFGDFVDGNPNKQGNPYMQFLSVTNPSDAHKDFVRNRLNGVDTTGDSAHALLPASKAQHSPQSTSEKAKNAFFRYWPWIVAGLGVFIVTGLLMLLFRCCCGRRRSRQSQVPGGMFITSPYKPIHDAPSAVHLHNLGPTHRAYPDPYNRS